MAAGVPPLRLLVFAALCCACGSGRDRSGAGGPQGLSAQDAPLVAQARGCFPGVDMDPPCAACVARSCRADCEACAAEPGCRAMMECASQCKHTPDCVRACLGTHPNRSFSRLIGRQSCAAPCETACTAPSEHPCDLMTGAAACDRCVRDHCRLPCARASSTAAMRTFACLQACSDSECERRCELETPGGAAALRELLGPDGCVPRMCAGACEGHLGDSGRRRSDDGQDSAGTKTE